MKWKDKLINDLVNSLEGEPGLPPPFLRYLKEEFCNIHLAVFNEPFLSLIFEGVKTIESRFSLNKVTPFQKIFVGDIIVMKKAGGPILGIAKAKSVFYFSNLNTDKIATLKVKFGTRIAWEQDPDFFANKSTSNFLTLVELDEIKKVEPINTGKNDRTAWSVLRPGNRGTLFQKISI